VGAMNTGGVTEPFNFGFPSDFTGMPYSMNVGTSDQNWAAAADFVDPNFNSMLMDWLN
jgi:hypothetical protein